MTTTNVWAVVGRVTGITSVRASEASARRTVDRWNADPFTEPGTPDPDAPYSVEATTLERIEAATGKRWGITSDGVFETVAAPSLHLRTPARFLLSNPHTGFPMVLRLAGGRPAVERRSPTMAIERARDAGDAVRLSAFVRDCPTLETAAARLKAVHGCDDIEADFDPTTPNEQERIDMLSQVSQALDHLIEACHFANDPADTKAIKALIKSTRAVLGE